jgi:predicted transposase/invertase (TIGR01784 family)
MSKLDVLAKLGDGTKIDIEVQIKNQHNIEKRSPYYWALKYSRGIEAGDDYAQLAPVICINILDFDYWTNIKDFHTSFHIYEDKNKDVMLTEDCEIHYLEMPKFRKILRGKNKDVKFNVENPMHRWLAYFDKDCPQDVLEEVLKRDNGIREFQGRMDMIQRDPALRRTYEAYEKAASDRTSEINDAKRQIAKNFKMIGIPIEQIAQGTGLSVLEIKRL